MTAGEDNGPPLQCSFLANPKDGRAWWAAIYGVAQSQTRLKRLSSSSRETASARTGSSSLGWAGLSLYSTDFSINCISYELLYTFNTVGFTSSSNGKESACTAGDRGSIPGSGRSPGKRNGNLLQYSCLKNSMGRGPGWLQSMGSQRVRYDCATNSFSFYLKN